MSDSINIVIEQWNDDNASAIRRGTGKTVCTAKQGRGENAGTASTGTVLSHDVRHTLMDTLLENGVFAESFCGQKGLCGRCRVRFSEGATAPTGADRRVFSPEELRDGWRLACMARPRTDCRIALQADGYDVHILTGATDERTDIDQISQHSRLPLSKQPHQPGQPDDSNHFPQRNQSNCIVAVDLGTTTIAMALADAETGRILDTYSALNPQRRYGADVLSRIQAASDGQAQTMQALVLGVLQDGLAHFRENGASAEHLYVAGNTTMEHLLMGLSVEGLGKSPFAPATKSAIWRTVSFTTEPTSDTDAGANRKTDTCVSAQQKAYIHVYAAPIFSAFVGGDIAAGLYHCGMLPISEKARKSAISQKTDTPVTLLIDLGTNGEMAMTDGERLIVTATAAGPAFEGGAGVLLPGSDMVSVTAGLLEQGIMDRTGLLREPYFSEGVPLSDTARFTQADVRTLQMAKAAVRAGLEILWERFGRRPIGKVFLAGGFGYYLSPKAAVQIGLLPEELLSVTEAAGNTSLAGILDMARDLASGALDEETLEEQLARAECVNLAAEPNFQDSYVRFMNF